MPRVLIVDDDDDFRIDLQESFETVVGEGNVDAATTYKGAVALLNTEYNVHVLDGEFPYEQGHEPSELGIRLAGEIHGRRGSYERVVVLSNSSRILDEAYRLGIQAYDKMSTRFDDLIRDLMPLLSDETK